MKESMKKDGGETRSRGQDLAWGLGSTPSRGPRPALSTTEIARVAIEIADAGGLESVTMKRVAQELGVTTMALYRYFPGKAALVGLMIDSAGESAPPFRKSSSPWHKRLKLWAHSCLRGHISASQSHGAKRALMDGSRAKDVGGIGPASSRTALRLSRDHRPCSRIRHLQRDWPAHWIRSTVGSGSASLSENRS
jgi:hypothetical protein